MLELKKLFLKANSKAENILWNFVWKYIKVEWSVSKCDNCHWVLSVCANSSWSIRVCFSWETTLQTVKLDPKWRSTLFFTCFIILSFSSFASFSLSLLISYAFSFSSSLKFVEDCRKYPRRRRRLSQFKFLATSIDIFLFGVFQSLPFYFISCLFLSIL